MKSLILPLSIFFCSSIYSQNLQSGLVGHFPLDGNADDISTLNIDGTVNGPLATFGVLNQPNTAMQISSSSTNYSINCGTSNRGITDQMSMSIWIKSTSTATNHFISKYDWNLDGGFYIGAYQNKAILAGRDGSNQFIYAGLGTTTINDGVWHHIVATCDGNSWKLYVDCNLETTINTNTSFPDLTCGMPLTIGHYYYGQFGDYRIFDGSLDDARLYDRALNANEISMLCNISSSNLMNLGNDTIICSGQSFLLDASGSPGTYLWQDNSTNSTLNATTTGTYWVEVTNNGYVSSDSIIISIDSIPSVNLGNDTILCFGETLILDATNSFGNYYWQNGSTAPSYNIDQSGVYWLTVSNLCGSVTDSIIVDYYPVFSFNLGNDTLICSGQSLLLDASGSPGTYLWQDNSTNSTLNATTTGTYWVEVTNNGCVISDSIIITMDYFPNINLGNDTILCFGESLILDASSSIGNYFWQNGSTISNYTINQNGVYWLTVSNSCGSDIDSIVVDYFPVFSFSLGEDTTICSGSSIELISDFPNISLIWQDGSVGTSYTTSETGIYSAQYIYNGCVSNDSILITVDYLPQVDLGADLLICEGEQTTLSIQNQSGFVEWNTGSFEQTIFVNSVGVYSVIVTNSCGITSDSILLETEECFCTFYVPNAFTPNGDEFNSVFGPVFDCTISAYNLKILNRWGEVIFESTDPNYKWDGTYLGWKIPEGIYTYKIIYSQDFSLTEMVVGHVSVIR